jgi:alpha-beta hydrolase superfamily lysophospholipase
VPDDPPLPRLEPVGHPPDVPRAIVLVLHGGRSRSQEPGDRKRLAYWRMLPIARMIAARGPAVFVLRYHYRGWNAPAKDAQRDAEWALAELGRRHPGTPVVLVGHSMGGRAALGAAGARNVLAVHSPVRTLRGIDDRQRNGGRVNGPVRPTVALIGSGVAGLTAADRL